MKIGKFSLSLDFLLNNEEEAKQVFSDMIVFRAECMAYDKTIEYQAVSDDFDEIEEGAIIPTYVAIMFRETIRNDDDDLVESSSVKGWQRIAD